MMRITRCAVYRLQIIQYHLPLLSDTGELATHVVNHFLVFREWPQRIIGSHLVLNGDIEGALSASVDSIMEDKRLSSSARLAASDEPILVYEPSRGVTEAFARLRPLIIVVRTMPTSKSWCERAMHKLFAAMAAAAEEMVDSSRTVDEFDVVFTLEDTLKVIALGIAEFNSQPLDWRTSI